MEIRTLPAVDKRVETGPIQFEGDWPGTFIRGDSAGYYALLLGMLLDEAKKAKIGDPIRIGTLRGLQRALSASQV